MSEPRRRILHIEPSSRCTIACMHCPRTKYPDHMSIEDIDIDTVVRACSGFDTLAMCGNHGDPIYHPDLHGLLGRVRSAYPAMTFFIITNGSHRTARWWGDLAAILRDGDELVFSIDGLPENNHLYRENSRWNTIEDAVRAVRAVNREVAMTWKWILFNYNEHQVLRGIRLAKSLGFNHFKVVGSTREEENDPLLATRTVIDVREELIASGIPTV